jgi:diguanylate cyclase (GGDEF)-like protein
MRPLSLLYCDLDGFKTVNDTLGHDAGDEVLKAVAERLLAITRAGDTVARLGGDEFVVLIEDGGDAGEAAARIAAALAQPAAVGRHRVELAASIGIAELTPQAPTVDATTLLQRADAAMYHAKRGGTGRKVARDGTAAGAPATA